MNKYKRMKVNGICIDEHRLIMGQHIGRKLKSSEAVHHKDGNRRNNIIENLELMTVAEHSQMHMRELWKRPEYQEKHSGGHISSSSKLNADSIRLIRMLLKYNYLRQIDIAKMFGVARQTINNINTGLNWSWVK